MEIYVCIIEINNIKNTYHFLLKSNISIYNIFLKLKCLFPFSYCSKMSDGNINEIITEYLSIIYFGG